MLDQKSALPPLIIKGKKISLPIIQGGMGVGVSLHPLARAVAREGGVGIVSSACLDRLVSKRNGKKMSTYEATYEEISLARSAGGFAGINIMVALGRDYEASVKGALDAGADAIISGAGLPLNLPAIQVPGDTALIPIVSSARALNLICKKWERLKYRPDAVVLEGPLAGGHIGFKIDEIPLQSNRLENLLPPVKDVARKYGDFPVIVAGGIFTHDDILKFLNMGADGVQIGTRFLATEESSATQEYKQAVLNAKEEDIIVATKPGSPCGLPFRVIRQSLAYVRERAPKCDKGYVLLKDSEGKYSICAARESNEMSFCICNGLLSSSGYNADTEKPLYTVGTNACRIDKIVSVKTLMDELADRVGVSAV
ncbi:MAG TPA: nitronate monooxygenase family protein [Thermodesulfovibrionales bacterium]|nr:nitronate monooxygenase family protein [Thermodesulfovibrionales bacterium]